MASSFPRRLSGIPMIALLSGLSVSVSIYHIVAHEAPLLPTILGQWSLLLVSLCFGAVGWYAFEHVDTVRQRSLIGIHASLMFGLAGLASAGYGVHQYLSPNVGIPEEGVLFEALFVAVLAGMIGTVTGLEVARRDRALANLQLERDKFSELFENIPDPAVEYESEDGELTLTRANDTFVDQFDVELPVSMSEFNQAVAGLDHESEARELDQLICERKQVSEEVLRQTATGRRWFELHSATHPDGGFALYFDITEKYLRGQQIQVLSRVLRHNLRNNLTVARGYVEQIARETEQDEIEANTEKIRSAIEELLEIANRIRTVRDHLEEDPPKPQRTEIAEIARNRISDARRSFPNVDFAIEESGERWARAHPTLGVVIDILLETLVEHNDQKQPRIDITVETVAEQGDEYLTIHITDNGTGLSEQELIPLRTGEEPTELRHASDVDLWMANWFVDQFGGVLQSRASEAEGTSIQIEMESV